VRLLLLGLAILAGLFYAMSAKALKPVHINISRPPGKLVSIGTHRLYLYCVGNGSPTVVLDAGLGGSSLEWLAVQQKLAAHTRVCAYDRAGYGWSESGPGPRTSLRNALELRALLAHANIEPPYVLAGHSFGGYTVQLFTSLYPKSVAGLVLVDSSHSGQVERFEAEPIGVTTAPRSGSIIMMSQPVIPDNLPEGVSNTVAVLMSAAKALSASSNELQHFRLSAEEVRRAPRWPDVPVVVLTRGLRVWPSDEKGQLMEVLWKELQNELAARTSHSLHIVVRGSGHYIHLDQPEIVAHAIDLLVETQRKPTASYAVTPGQARRYPTLLAAHTVADDSLFSDLYTTRTVAKRLQ
jgi:pimeloyl-ACP methyl ester carboxylesterase